MFQTLVLFLESTQYIVYTLYELFVWVVYLFVIARVNSMVLVRFQLLLSFIELILSSALNSVDFFLFRGVVVATYLSVNVLGSRVILYCIRSWDVQHFRETV